MLYAPKERGQGLVEYALILVLVAVVVIVILALLRPAVGNVFCSIVRPIWAGAPIKFAVGPLLSYLRR